MKLSDLLHPLMGSTRSLLLTDLLHLLEEDPTCKAAIAHMDKVINALDNAGPEFFNVEMKAAGLELLHLIRQIMTCAQMVGQNELPDVPLIYFSDMERMNACLKIFTQELYKRCYAIQLANTPKN